MAARRLLLQSPRAWARQRPHTKVGSPPSPFAMEANPSEDMALDGRAFNKAATLWWNTLFPIVFGDGKGAGEGAGEGQLCQNHVGMISALVHRLANIMRTKRRRWGAIDGWEGKLRVLLYIASYVVFTLHPSVLP
jgi:hypothetical protein